MKYLNLFVIFLLCISAFIIIVLLSNPPPTGSRVLRDYVYKYDPAYKWTLNATLQNSFATIYVIELTSQEWMKDNSSSPLWKHWLQICVPTNVDPSIDTALLYIDGGKNQNWAVPTVDTLSSFGLQLCQASGEITVSVPQVPNQYLIFNNDSIKRSEDEIIAYTWRKFIDTKDSNWISLLPQTKSAIKAMDAVQEFVATPAGKSLNIKNFVVTGASKRGWTTWGTAMTGDPRVVGIAPMVIPILDVKDNLGSQMRDFGNWSFELVDYIDNGIELFLYTPYFKLLTDIIDPINFIDTFENIPKFIVMGSSDEFFPPDSTKFFFYKLKGETKLGIYNNTNHNGIKQPAVIADITTFKKLISAGKPRAEMTWVKTYSEDQNNGTIDLQIVKGVATSVTVFYASTISTTMRDFRMYTCEAAECYQNITWNPIVYPLSKTNQYSITMGKPEAGYTGFYFRVGFADQSAFTSEIAIVPNTLPFPPCSEALCDSGVPAYMKKDDSTSDY